MKDSGKPAADQPFGKFEAERISLKRAQPGAFCVEASAGTGKTYSITGLVLRLVCEENLPLDEILVVTFTRAAAAELRGRIGRRLADAQQDLERLEQRMPGDEKLLERFLKGDAEAGKGVFGDDFVARWVRAALAGQDEESVKSHITTWLDRIRRARQRVDAATFVTIHSFCQRMLEWHAFESNQPLGITFIEDASLIRAEIANDLWGEIAEGLPDEWLALLLDPPGAQAAKAVAKLDCASFVDAVAAALESRGAVIQVIPEWQEYRLSSLREGLSLHSELLRTLVEDEEHIAFRYALIELSKCATAGKWVQHVPELKGATAATMSKVLPPMLRARCGHAGAFARYGVFWAGVFAYLASEAWEGGFNKGKNKAQKKLYAELSAAPDLVVGRQRLQPSLFNMRALRDGLVVNACQEARRRYEARLAEHAEVTFDDLITRLAERVQKEAESGDEGPLTLAVRSRFRAALIDEFQDTDDAQWSIFEKVFLDSPDHRLFLIGDPKQAIYRFRGADIHTYLRARERVNAVAAERLSGAGTAQRGGNSPGIHTMTRNFRSDAALIVALNRFMGALYCEGKSGECSEQGGLVDSVASSFPEKLSAPVALRAEPGKAVRGFFDRRDAEEGPKIDYIIVDWQRPTRRVDEDCVGAERPPSSLVLRDAGVSDATTWTAQPLVFRPVTAPLPGGGLETELDLNEACKRMLPRTVAADIRRLLESGTQLQAEMDGDAPSAPREVSPGDIAVIVHTWKMGHAIAGQLRTHGIPSVIMAGEVVWQCDEAEDLSIVLHALLNLRYQPAVVAALATPLLSVAPKHLCAFAGGASELPELWLETLDRLARTWEKRGLLRMLSELLDLRVVLESGLPGNAASGAPTRREALLRVADGERRLTNLLQVAELLHGECSGRFLGPQGQLDLLRARMVGETRDAGSPDDPRKQRLDTDDLAVRITTVFGSKGLEYPIVFLPGFDAKAIQSNRFSAPAVIPDFSGERRRVLYATKGILEATTEAPDPKTRDAYDAEEESRRLLYVALTRARHQAVLYVRDWKGTSLGELRQTKSAATMTILGSLLDSTPRVRALAAGEAGETLISAACIELGKAVNPVGESIFPVPRSEAELPGRPDSLWVAGAEGEDCQELETSLSIARERFYDAAYLQASFSSLAKGGAAAAESADGSGPAPSVDAMQEAIDASGHDRGGNDEQDSDEDEAEERSDAEAEDVVLLFESAGLAGRDFGSAIHELLEKAAFDAPVSRGDDRDDGARPGQGEQPLEEATARVVRRYGFQLRKSVVQDIARDVHGFLHAPLGGPLGSACLAAVPRKLRIDELEFLLPVPEKLTQDALRSAFRQGSAPAAGTSWTQVEGSWESWLDTVQQISFGEFHGFLKGFVDLVFALPDACTQFHILDYKTNRLHRREMSAAKAADAYAQPALVHAMIGSRYVLQYHLYQVALYRLLRSRFGRDFEWDRHMGGVWYPFLRGVESSASAPVAEGGLRRGIFYDRPPRERIEALSDLFGPLREGDPLAAAAQHQTGSPS